METLTLYNIIILIFTVIAFVSNLGSLIYVTKTFDIKQSFFHILIMDAIVVIGSTLLSSITIVLVIFGQILGKFCGCLLFGAAITVLSSPMSFIMISFIRYKKVKDIENRWYTNKQLVKASYVAFGLLLLYGVICTFINSHFELQSYNIYNVCLHGENAKKNKILFNCLTIMLPVVIMVIAAGVVDLLSYFWLQKRENNSRREYIKNDIPLRATAISTSLHAIFIFVFVILGIQKVQPIDK
eukprot:10818.XXX_532590_533825_1 [CDS] Oithona nana genome sequencing.